MIYPHLHKLTQITSCTGPNGSPAGARWFLSFTTLLLLSVELGFLVGSFYSSEGAAIAGAEENDCCAASCAVLERKRPRAAFGVAEAVAARKPRPAFAAAAHESFPFLSFLVTTPVICPHLSVSGRLW